MYWSTAEDTSLPVVPTVMTRDRFRKIKRYFHLKGNNQLEKDDKLCKKAPIYVELCKNLQQFGIWHEKLSIDKSMVPYYGRYKSKMFIKGILGLDLKYGQCVYQRNFHTLWGYTMEEREPCLLCS